MKKIEPSQTDEQPRPPVAACKHLRNKEMFYEQAGEEDAEFASEVFWCSKSQEAFGPDGEAAGNEDCKSGRSCYDAL